MSKGKKILKFLLIVAVIVAVVVGAIFLLNPKADVSMPFSHHYDITQNQEFAKVKDKNETLVFYMEGFTVSPDAEKESLIENSEPYLNTFKTIINLTDTYESLDSFISNNIAYLNEKGLVKVQKKLNKSYKSLSEKITTCLTFIDENIKPLEPAGDPVLNIQTTSYSMFNQIVNYSTYLYEMVDELNQFYSYLMQIMSNNTKDSFVMNEYSRLTLQTVSSWSELVAENKTNTDYSMINFSAKLNLFVNIKNLNNSSDYVLNTEKQQTVELSQGKDIVAILDAMMKDTLDEYVNSFADIDERKSNSQFILKYFQINIEVTQEVA